MSTGRPSEEAIFNVARKLPDAEARADYLAQVCGDDAPLRARVEALLAARDEHPDFLSTPHDTPGDSLPETAPYRPPPEGPGTTIGHFKLLEKIGEGTYGVVYEADQQRPARRVALKVLREGLNSPEYRARFQIDHNALALMNHPNIARVYEAGVTADHRPYFAMELARGLNLTAHCDKNNLPVEVRLRLFQDVCHAVHHAHQRGILHRDLKPGNILVTSQEGRPVVKVIDFGIAKALHGQRLTDLTHYTRGVMGTVAYMSPEQADPENRDIDTRTDVYALGVILYELLTGTTPFDGRRLWDAGDKGRARILREEEPPVPSTRISTLGAAATEVSAHRRTDPARLRSTLRGDLDRVVLKALEKKREERYDSASELAADVGRHLAHEPVKAVPPSWSYRLRKFAYRNRRGLAVAGAAAVVLAVVGATLAAGWWRDRQRALARAAVPQVRGLIAAEEFTEAWKMARDARRWLPDDPLLEELWQQATAEVAIRSDPPGAAVSLRDWRADAAPVSLGRTPLEAVRVPRGALVWQATLAGHAPQEFLATLKDQGKLHLSLDPAKDYPEGMVHVRGPDIGLDYYLDRDEVTNRQYAALLAANGYANPALWTELAEAHKDTWQAELAKFVDKTGKPGPATWSNGACPPGQEDHPVTGVSWYEAAAYACYAGKQLPTVFHWEYAAGLDDERPLLRLSNFANAGTIPVGRSRAVSRSGAWDMAGNAKEWVFNACGDGTRFALGAAWNDPTYLFPVRDRIRPLSRPANTGFRCARYRVTPTSTEQRVFVAPAQARPIIALDSQELAAVRKSVHYDPATPLEPVTLTTEGLPGLGTHEVVAVNAAYGGQKLTLHLFLPPGISRPYQTVVYFPGAAAQQHNIFTCGPPNWDFGVVSAYLRIGRAACFPVYCGTYERKIKPGTLHEREWHTRMVQDLRRAVDYLATRSETFNLDALIYVGSSFGASLGPMMTVLEPRLSACVLQFGGTALLRTREVSSACFAAHMTQPVFMINGRDDAIFSYESSQLPLFQAIGSADKEFKPQDNTGHGMPQSAVMPLVTPWLDQRLGRPTVDLIPDGASHDQLLLFEKRARTYAESGLLDQAEDLTGQLLRQRQGDPAHSDDLFRVRGLVAELHCRRGRLEEGSRLFDELLHELRQKHGAQAPQTADAMTRHAAACRDRAQQLVSGTDPTPADYSLAARLTERALHIDPSCEHAHWILALTHYRRGDFPACLQELHNSARIDPPGVVQYLLLALVHLRLGQRDQAQDFHAAAADWTARDGATWTLARDLASETRAALLLPQVTADQAGVQVRLLPLLPRGRLTAHIHERLGNPQAAEADLTAALGPATGLAPLHIARGDLRIRHARWQDAQDDFTKAIDLAPADYWNRYRLAALRLFLGDAAGCRALAAYLLGHWPDANAAKVCSLLPVNAADLPRLRDLVDNGFESGLKPDWLLQVRGMLDYRAGQWSGAVKALGRARTSTTARIDCLDATTLAYQAMALHQQRDRAAAMAHLHWARDLVFRQGPLAGRGVFSVAWWDWLIAFEAYTEAAHLIEGTDRALARKELLALMDIGKAPPDKALATLTATLDRYPDCEALLRQRADLHLRQRQWPEAAADLAPFVQREPHAYIVPFRLACLRHQAGDRSAYQDLCRLMRQRYHKLVNTQAYLHGLGACLIDPQPVEDPAILADQAEFVLVRDHPDVPRRQADILLGLAFLRAGRLKEAGGRLEAAHNVTSPTDPFPLALCALAVAQARLGQPDKARESLRLAAEIQARNAPPAGELHPNWQDGVLCDIHRREAEEVLKTAPAKPSPPPAKDKAA